MREIYRDSRDVRPNERSAGNGGTELLCHIGRPWPAVPGEVNVSTYMSRIFFSTLCLMVLLGAYGARAREDGFRVTPTVDTNFPGGIYIPRDIPDAHRELLKMLPKSVVEEMKAAPRKDMILYHRSLGQWLRNEWGLWSGSRLKKKLLEDGFEHPDEMSGTILDTFWCHLHGQTREIEREINKYKKRPPEQKNSNENTNAATKAKAR